MFTSQFWVDAAERAIRTAAEALLSLWLVGDVALNAFTIDWYEAGGIALGAALLSVLASLVASRRGSPETASLVDPRVPHGFGDVKVELDSGPDIAPVVDGP